MIIISKEEAMALRAKYGRDANITITSRNKKGGRKKYYLPEEGRLLAFLERFRNRHLRKNTKDSARKRSNEVNVYDRKYYGRT